jgi:blue copper oxidase
MGGVKCTIGHPAPLDRPDEAKRTGWTEIAPISAGADEILVRFFYVASPATPHLAHGHNLEHPDSGIVIEFTVP